MPQNPSGERRRPSVYDVAERAGVSIATVSRVLRSSAPVATSTRDRVLAAAADLDWRPSRLARAFVSQSHGAVGIVFPDLGGPYFPRLIAGFEAAAAERGVAVLVAATHGRPNAADLVSDLADRVDGLVIVGRTVSDDQVRALRRGERAVVLLARPPLDDVPAIRAANTAPAVDLTTHVLGHGCARIVFAGDPDLSPDIVERWRGVRRALRAAGAPTATLVRTEGLDTVHGFKAGLDLFASGSTVDAIICANDEVAAGIVRAAGASGRHVPDDLVVTGWDDSPLAAGLHPPLTTVHQPVHALGTRSAHALFALVDGETAKSVVLRAPLQLRESCGCSQPPTGTDLPPPSTAQPPTSQREQQGGTP